MPTEFQAKTILVNQVHFFDFLLIYLKFVNIGEIYDLLENFAYIEKGIDYGLHRVLWISAVILMDKFSYLQLFRIYSDAMTSDSTLGIELRQVINLDKIWNKLSDDERQEMKRIFSDVVNKIGHEILRKRNKSLKAFKKGMKKK